MNTPSDYFAEYFAMAQMDALTERESQIIELRYGFMGGDPHTLEEIAHEFGVSRERIRQILKKSHRKILLKGQRQLKNSRIGESCAELLSYVKETIRPKDENAVERLVDFVENALPHLPVLTHALPLISFLAFQSLKAAKAHMPEARKLIREHKYAQRKLYKQRIQSEKFQELLSYVIWPSKVKLPTEKEISTLGRQRNISLSGEGKAGIFHSGKMDRPVWYESELELDFLLHLEQLEEVASYQEQPFKVPYEYDDRSCLYFPDVLLILTDGRGVVVEIKPVFKMALQENLTKWTALRMFCAERGLGILITDGRHSIQQVQRLEVNPKFGNSLLASLRRGSLSWAQYREIRDKYGASKNDFLALILRHKLVWKLRPFTLSLAY